MSIKDEELSILCNNQIKHFDELRSKGIDPGIPNEWVYTIIKVAYTEQIQEEVFSLNVLKPEDDSGKYYFLNAAPDPEGEGKERLNLESRMYDLKNYDLVMGTDVASILKLDIPDITKANMIGEVLRLRLSTLAILRVNTVLLLRATEIEFDAEDISLSEHASYCHRAQDIGGSIEQCGDIIFEKLKRGSVNKILATDEVIVYFRLHAQAGLNRTSIYGRNYSSRLSIGGIPVYQIPQGLPKDTCVCVCKNEENKSDISIIFNTCIPLCYSQSTKDFSVYGDYEIIQPDYLQMTHVSNLRK